jgi:D-alanine-D-alanine ligase-like ATP-grasp enzyme
MKEYEEYLKIAGNVHLAYYIEAAEELCIHYEVLIKSLLSRFEYKGKHWFIINTATPLTNTTATTISKRKSLTNFILDKANIPVPKQVVLNSAVDAIKFFNRYENIVIKPSQQLGGKGITLLPENEDQVIQAYNEALEKTHAKGNDKVLGEQFLSGENYRFLVVGNNVVGMVRRKSAHVIGDGKSTISELIDIKNIERKNNLLMPITIDNEVELRLKNSNKTLDSVPELNEEVVLRYNCNLTTGGTTEECSCEVHQYYKDLAVKAVKAVDSEFGGVDIIAENISQPSKCGVNEINYNPGLRIHYKVDKGDVVKVAVPIMEYIRDKYINSK